MCLLVTVNKDVAHDAAVIRLLHKPLCLFLLLPLILFTLDLLQQILDRALVIGSLYLLSLSFVRGSNRLI